MWLFLPSTYSPSAPVLECSTPESCSPLNGAASPVALWVALKGKHVQRPLSWPGWKRRPRVRLLSGTTLPRSTADHGADVWIASLRASRASLTPLPGNVPATPTIEAGERPGVRTAPCSTPSASSTKCAPPWCSSRTFQPGLPGDTSDDLARRYADWVMRSKTRSSWLRKTLARRIGASGSSSWPSTRAVDSQRGGNHPGATDSLTGATKAWPTSNARDAKGIDQHHHEGAAGNSLPNAVVNWATAQAHDIRKRGAGNRLNPLGGGACLATEVCELPFIRPGAATNPTPTTPTSALGLLLQSWARPECPRLNPVFQWWLMGWPSPTLIFSASAATEWFRWRQQSLSMLCFLLDD